MTEDEQGSTIRQTAIFDPVGLLGLLYWYGIYPLHQLVFAGMLRNLARAGVARSQHRRLRRARAMNIKMCRRCRADSGPPSGDLP